MHLPWRGDIENGASSDDDVIPVHELRQRTFRKDGPVLLEVRQRVCYGGTAILAALFVGDWEDELCAAVDVVLDAPRTSLVEADGGIDVKDADEANVRVGKSGVLAVRREEATKLGLILDRRNEDVVQRTVGCTRDALEKSLHLWRVVDSVVRHHSRDSSGECGECECPPSPGDREDFIVHSSGITMGLVPRCKGQGPEIRQEIAVI